MHDVVLTRLKTTKKERKKERNIERNKERKKERKKETFFQFWKLGYWKNWQLKLNIRTIKFLVAQPCYPASSHRSQSKFSTP
jgi:hypothetical protein